MRLVRDSGEKFAEDLQGGDVDGGFGVEFQVAEDFFRYFVAQGAVQRDEHDVREIFLHQTLYYRIMLSDEGLQVAGFGAESKGYREFEQEPQMEIAEIALHGVQKQDAPFAPFEKPGLIRPVLERAVKDFAHEEGHGILVKVAADAHERMLGREVFRSVKC